MAGSYRASPVRKVVIPNPDGNQRELGIPTVLDRLPCSCGVALCRYIKPCFSP